MVRLHGDKSKINACMIKESPGNWESNWTSWHNSRELMEYILQQLETILPTRLDDESFRGLLNFKRSTMPDTPINEIEKALVRAKNNYAQMHATKVKCFVLICFTGIFVWWCTQDRVPHNRNLDIKNWIKKLLFGNDCQWFLKSIKTDLVFENSSVVLLVT